MPRDAHGRFIGQAPARIPDPVLPPGGETTSPRLLSYTVQYGLALGTAFGALILGGLSQNGTVLGLTPAHLALIAIGQTCLTLAAGLLPKLYRPPSDDRVGQD